MLDLSKISLTGPHELKQNIVFPRVVVCPNFWEEIKFVPEVPAGCS